MKTLLLILLLTTQAYAQTTKYDKYFITATKKNFGSQVNPAWLKAVGMAESALKYNARSVVGAQGLMQFMSSTWSSVAPEPWKSLGALDPEAAIMVGGLYLRQIWDRYPTIDTYNRKAFTNAGYNSGPGNVNKAITKCKATPKCIAYCWDYPNVEATLVTKIQFQEETRNYVKRIRQFETKLIAAGGLH